jgi:hypothetical protein
MLTTRKTKLTEVKNKYHVASISWPDKETKNAAKVRAKRLGLSFSNYINQLVMKDLGKGGRFEIKPTEE